MKNTKKILTVLIMFLFLLSSSSFAARKTKPVSSSKLVKININSANISQLSTLPRIGKKISERIINFRKKHGKFKKIEEIMKVKGIGEKVFRKIKNRIKVS